MTIHYVDASGVGGTFKTLNEAARVVKSGDEIVMRDGVYDIAAGRGVAGGKVALGIPNTTWRAETPGRAIIHGDWGPQLLQNPMSSNPEMPDGGKHVGGSLHGALITIQADGVTLDGLVIECVPCGGIDVAASHVTVRNCVTYWTRSQGLSAKKGDNGTPERDFAEDLTVEGCAFISASAGRLDPAWVRENTSAGGVIRPDPATGAVQLSNLRGPVVFRNNLVAESIGEGCDTGKRAYGTAERPILIENNIFRNCRHAQFYINHCRHVIVRGNVSYVTEGSPLWRIPPGDAGYCYIVRDERPDLFPPSANLTFEGNVAAGGDCFQLAKRGEKEFTAVVVRHNTFVSGVMTAKPLVSLVAGAGVFERNVIHHAAGDVPIAAGGAGYTARENGWSSAPPKTLAAVADVVGELRLSNPGRRLQQSGLDSYPATYTEYATKVRDNFDLADYRPLALSPLIAHGSEGVTLGALTAVSEPPDEPEPPAVDWEELATLATGVRERLTAMAQVRETIGEQLAVFDLAHGDAAGELAALMAKLEEYQAA